MRLFHSVGVYDVYSFCRVSVVALKSAETKKLKDFMVLNNLKKYGCVLGCVFHSVSGVEKLLKKKNREHALTSVERIQF